MIGVITALLLGSALADCPYFNLYDQKENPLYQIPIREQGPSYTCYAHTAAQMVDYFLIADRLKKGNSSHSEISPFWVALNHKVSSSSPRHWIYWDSNSLGNSYLLWALQDLRSQGNCAAEKTEAAIATFQSELKLPYSLNPDELFYLLERLWPKIGTASSKDQRSLQIWIQKDEDLRDYDRDLKKSGRPELKLVFQKMLSSPVLIRFHHQYSRVIDFFSSHIFKSCKDEEHTPVSFPKIKNFGTGIVENSEIISKLNSWLNPTDRRPVAVGYCEQIYLNQKISPLSDSILPRALAIQTTHCWAHYSLLVGRRPDSAGHCEYLIRNSHGTDFWTKKWDCLCSNEKTGQNEACRYSQSSPKPASGQKVLGCWAPQNELAPYVYDLEQL